MDGEAGRRRIVRSVFVVLALVASSCARPPDRLVIDSPPRSVPQVPLADADLADFQGVVSGSKGRPVVVNIWASWCGPCRVEMPLLERASRAYGEQVQFLGVASRDQRVPAEEFLRRYGVTYPNLLDDSGQIRRFLTVRGFPTTYVFDRRGRLVARTVGSANEQTLAAQIDDALRR